MAENFGADDRVKCPKCMGTMRVVRRTPHPDLGGDAPLALLTKGSAKDLADYVRGALSGQPT